MTENSDFYLIVAHDVDDTQRNLIQAAVKSVTSVWWHEIPDIWLVGGGGPTSAWRVRLLPFMQIGESGVFVFQLPAEGGRAWSAFSYLRNWKWIDSTYAAPSGRPPTSSSVTAVADQDLQNGPQRRDRQAGGEVAGS